MTTGAEVTSEYALGHSSEELDRLNEQAKLIGPITRHFFTQAGLRSGMRVLDVGSGAGDVALLARELVGGQGHVVGVDRSPAGIATAQSRAIAQGFENLTFQVGDPSDMSFDEPFDAVIGRYVLMFQSDPAGMLRRLAKLVRPGGTIVFHEANCDDARSIPPVPTYDRCWQWLVSALRGADTNLGTRFPSVFIKAGLPAPTMRLEALVGGGAESADCVELIVGLVATLLPEIEKLEIASATEVGLGTLRDRLLREAIEKSSVLIGRSEIGAWCRV